MIAIAFNCVFEFLRGLCHGATGHWNYCSACTVLYYIFNCESYVNVQVFCKLLHMIWSHDPGKCTVAVPSVQ